jgi:excisionase family DNA binding protein
VVVVAGMIGSCVLGLRSIEPIARASQGFGAGRVGPSRAALPAAPVAADNPSAMSLAQFCTVAEACRIAGVSDGYMRRLLREGKIDGQKVGTTYLVLRSSVAKFERQPGMGRPPLPRPAGRRRPRK